MKRMLSSLTAILFCCLFLSIASAEPLDMSKLSDDDLLNLYAMVRQEISNRGLSERPSYSLAAGKYIVGQDIQPGTYLLSCTSTSGKDIENAYSSLGSMFESLGGEEASGYGNLIGSLGGLMGSVMPTTVKVIGDYGTVLKSYELKTDQSMQITLAEKTAIEVSDGTCTLTPVN